MKTTKTTGVGRRPTPQLKTRTQRKRTPKTRKSRPLTWREWLRQSFHESTPVDWIPAPYLDMVKRRTLKKRKATLH